jgi:glucose-1-phosphatase
MTPEFLYFDIGNVLLRFCNDTAIRQMAGLANHDAEQLRELFLGPSERESVQWWFERGDITTEQYVKHYHEATGHEPDLATFSIAASDMFSPIKETLLLAARLHKAGHRLGILSNTNPLHWAFMSDRRFPGLPELFEQYALSFNARAMKPEPAIYQYAVELAGVDARHVFFVDDRIENVAGARAVGIDAVQFVSTKQLASDLREREIEWES